MRKRTTINLRYLNCSCYILTNRIKQYAILACLLFTANLHAQEGKDLEYYLSSGIQNSPLLKDYNNQMLSIGYDSALLKASYKPQVGLTGNNYYAPIVRGVGYDEAITNGTNIYTAVGVNKTFVSSNYYNIQLQTLMLQKLGISNAAHISEQDLKLAITTQYVTAFGDLLQYRFAEEIYNLLQKEDTLLRKLTQQNVYRQTDYLTFLVTLQQQELAMRQLSIMYKNDYATLNYMSGLSDTSFTPLGDPHLTLNILPHPETSVFFKKFVLDSLKLANSLRVVDLTYKPKVTLFVDGGLVSTFTIPAYKNLGASFGVNFSLPFYDGGQRKLQYNKIYLQEQTRLSYKDFFTRQYSQQVAQLVQQLNANREVAEKINTQIRYTETLIQANNRLLSTGDVRIADMIIAFNNYLSAKNLLTQNTISRLQLINQYNYWNR